jgi:hypothetical protein
VAAGAVRREERLGKFCLSGQQKNRQLLPFLLKSSKIYKYKQYLRKNPTFCAVQKVGFLFFREFAIVYR